MYFEYILNRTDSSRKRWDNEPMVLNDDYEAQERADFAARLCRALDDVPGVPFGHGRGAWLARGMGVTTKAAAKWLNGEAMPETAKIRKLAKLAGIDPARLLFGDISLDHQDQVSQQSREIQQILSALVEAKNSGALSKDLVTAILKVIKVAAPQAPSQLTRESPAEPEGGEPPATLDSIYRKQAIIDNRENLMHHKDEFLQERRSSKKKGASEDKSAKSK